MAFQVLPVDASPNQTFTSTLSIGGVNKRLSFGLSYNETGGYWVMRISDPASGAVLLDSLPLLPGEDPAANLLGQYAYLGIGSLYLVNQSNTPADRPDDKNLGTAFVLVWGD